MGLASSGSSLVTLLWTGFFVLEGFDFGVGMLHGRVGPHRRGAPAGDRLDRAALGRQRGLADRRRRRHVRRLPRLVRDDVLRPLPAAGPAAGRAHRPRRLVRVPGQAGLPPVAGHLEPSCTTVGSLVAPLLIGVALGDLLHGVPIDSQPGVHRQAARPAQPLQAVRRASRWPCCASLHGATFLALKVDGAVRDRARTRGPRGAHRSPPLAVLVFVVLDPGSPGPGGRPRRRPASSGSWRPRPPRCWCSAAPDGWAFTATTVAMAGPSRRSSSASTRGDGLEQRVGSSTSPCRTRRRRRTRSR